MIAVKALPLILYWLTLVYFDPTLADLIIDAVDSPVVVNPVIKTSSGSVRGITKTVLATKVDVFLGIPFAKPPLGQLRFKKPVPINPWAGVLNASKLPNTCQQERSDVFGTNFTGEQMWNPNTPVSEDCLYLNLWVPSGVKNATTLIWIYGGGYNSGTSTLNVYDGSILAANSKVIVASMNYRVGAFGFLYLGNADAPGNVGLFDQALAIEWIKRNVQSFGGNPGKMTLFGESAGASSVSALLISPVTQSLTRRAILESGSINAPWSLPTIFPQTAINVTRTIMKDAGCNPASPKVMDCMRKVDAKTLSQAQWAHPIMNGIPIGPTIDGVFFPKHPIKMLNEGKFPKAEILTGTNKDEGTYFALYAYLNYFNKDTPVSLTQKAFCDIINTYFYNQTLVQQAAIIFNYTKGRVVDDPPGSFKNMETINQIMGDYLITCPVSYMAQKFAAQGSSVYYYYFTQRTSDNPWGKWMGVLHADEIDYVFGDVLKPSRVNSTNINERDLSRRIMNYFTTFAETGKPTKGEPNCLNNWPKYSRSDPQYVILNANVFGQGVGLRREFCEFWEKLLGLPNY